MPFLAVFKRYEVWLLLLLIAGLFWLAFTPSPVTGLTLSRGKVVKEDPKSGPTDNSATNDPSAPKPSIVLRDVHIEESSGGQIVETRLEGISPTGSDLRLDGSAVQAISGDGNRIPLFFEPFQKDAILTAHENRTVTLRWWMVKPKKNFTLMLAGVEIPVDLP